MKILGIESSCDETAVAIVANGTTVFSSALASSMKIHALYGGVIPEIAARSHIESIIPVIEQVFKDSGLGWQDIDGVAVTYGAGLSGSLLIGLLTARTLAITHHKPLYAINHVEAHVYSNFLSEPTPQFPMLALIVSGGHSQLVYFKNHGKYFVLGQTVDDAIGEAFDKVAKIIGLPYPGGPSIARAARLGNPNKYSFPKAKLANKFDFSFSGLKTAVLRCAQQVVGEDFRLSSTEIPALLNDQQRLDIAASFQRIAIETVLEKTIIAYREYKPKSVVIAGGVAANLELRRQMTDSMPIKIYFTPPALCTDNGVMVASLGCYQAMNGIEPADPFSLEVEPNLKM